MKTEISPTLPIVLLIVWMLWGVGAYKYILSRPTPEGKRLAGRNIYPQPGSFCS